MKKAVLALILIVAMTMTATATAAETRTLRIEPYLSFSGTTAICEVSVTGDTTGDYIVAVVRLWDGNRLLETWTKSGGGLVTVDETYAPVTRGKTYTLTVDVTFNGSAKPRGSASATCP